MKLYGANIREFNETVVTHRGKQYQSLIHFTGSRYRDGWQNIEVYYIYLYAMDTEIHYIDNTPAAYSAMVHVDVSGRIRIVDIKLAKVAA